MGLRKLIFMCMSPFLLEGAFAQINLVRNPSFENIYNCPSSYSQLDSVIDWSTPIAGGGGSPEDYNACSVGNLVNVPVSQNGLCFQYAHSGNGYVGIDVISSHQVDNWREYIQSKLLNTLTSGKNYCVTFYVSLPNRYYSAYIRPLGAYLDSGMVFSPSFHGLAMVSTSLSTTMAIPQVYNTTQPLSDTLNWMKIEGSFTATGIESYITLGNFFTDANSDIGFIGSPASWDIYYFIDDISVIDVSTPAYAGRDTLIHLGDSVFVGRPPEVGLNEDCIWFVNNVAIDTVAGMWVKPIVPTTYVLKQTICGATTYDSVRVNIDGVGIENYQLSTVNYQLSPNPTTGAFSINLTGSITNDVIVTISDITGKQISSDKILLKDNAAIIDKGLTNGVYIISVKDSNGNIDNPKKITVIR